MKDLFSFKRGIFMLIVFGYLFISQTGLIEGFSYSGINYGPLTGVIKEEQKPNQLFDITFGIDNSQILNISDLTARVGFESFGKVSTKVNMTFIILDENKKEVFIKKESAVVETEKVFTEEFKNVNFGFGKYTLYLKTLYNGNVEDTFFKKFTIRSKISNSKDQLFDIKFELDKKIIEKSENLVGRVSFESFGSVPTPINLRFTFLDNTGRKVYSEENTAIVETEKVLAKKFSYLNLEKGDYILVLTTLYNGNVEDEFREKFTITGIKNYAWLNWLSFSLNFLFLFTILFLFRRSSFVKKISKKRK